MLASPNPSSYSLPHGRLIKSREKTLGQGIVTLLESWQFEMMDWQNPFPRQNLGFFLLKGEGVWLFIANFLVPESFILADVQVDLVTL